MRTSINVEFRKVAMLSDTRSPAKLRPKTDFLCLARRVCIWYDRAEFFDEFKLVVDRVQIASLGFV